MVDNNISSLLFLLFCIISQNKGWVRNYIHQYWIRCKGSIHYYTIIYFFHYYYPTLMLLLEIIIEDQEYLYSCFYHIHYKTYVKYRKNTAYCSMSTKNTKLIIKFLIKFYVIVFLFFMILKRKLYPEVFGLRLQYHPFLHTHTRICVLCGHYFSSNIRFHSHWT